MTTGAVLAALAFGAANRGGEPYLIGYFGDRAELARRSVTGGANAAYLRASSQAAALVAPVVSLPRQGVSRRFTTPGRLRSNVDYILSGSRCATGEVTPATYARALAVLAANPNDKSPWISITAFPVSSLCWWRSATSA